MNYTKLTLAITAGILLAAGIIAAVIEIPEYQRQKRIERRFALAGEIAHAMDCAPRDACLDQKYARNMTLVTKKLASIAQAAHAFCGETAWNGGTPERNAQLLAECDTATQKRMTDDLK